MRRRAADTAALRYVETSLLLAALLEGDPSARRSLRTAGTLVTSAITFAEARRGVVRARRTERLTADQEGAAFTALSRFRRRCAVLKVTDEVLFRVGKPFPVEPVRTLDAIHLATAAALADEPQLLTILTRDDRIRANAAAIGYTIE